MDKPRIVVITGPTASGKSELAVRLARYLGAEVVGADSRQVYRFLDVGTAKPGPAQRRAVAHHLLDVADPDEPFDVARYVGLARTAVADIVRRGQRVLVVGGTGLYIKGLTGGLCTGPKADAALRERLELEEATMGRGHLHRRLAGVDPQTARRLHPNDRVRVVRALEVFLLGGGRLSDRQREHGFRDRPFSTLTIALAPERAELDCRIERRCREMMQGGLVEEVERLWAMGYGPHLAPLRSIGYKQVGRCLRGEVGWRQAVAEMVSETRRFARRQLVWLRPHAEVQWFAPCRADEIARAVEKFLEGSDTGADAQHLPGV